MARKAVKIHKNSKFDFLTTCQEIKFRELQSTSNLAILHFISKLLLLFCSVKSFYPTKLYAWWHDDITWKRAKQNFAIWQGSIPSN